jgi:hypothetical protein
MTTKEVINQLINDTNYNQVRGIISDEFIEFVKEMLPSDYDYFAEKEQAYQHFKNQKPCHYQ